MAKINIACAAIAAATIITGCCDGNKCDDKKCCGNDCSTNKVEECCVKEVAEKEAPTPAAEELCTSKTDKCCEEKVVPPAPAAEAKLPVEEKVVPPAPAAEAKLPVEEKVVPPAPAAEAKLPVEEKVVPPTPTPAAEIKLPVEEKKDPAEVLISVNNVALTRGEVEAELDKMIAAQIANIPEENAAQAEQFKAFMKLQGVRQHVQRFMVETALSAAAKAYGYKIDDAEFEAFKAEIVKSFAGAPNAPKTFDELLAKSPLGKEKTLASVKTQMLIDKLIKGQVIDKDTKDYTAEANKIIDNIKAENAKCMSDEAAKAKIAEFKKQLDAAAADKKAALFAELAKKNSACPSGQKGGDLGDFTRGQMVEEFDKVAFTLNVGDISEPVRTDYGYHLIMTTKKTPATEGKGESVQASHILVRVSEPRELPKLENVVTSLKQRANRQAVGEFIQKMILKSNIKVADEFKDILPEEAPKPATPAK